MKFFRDLFTGLGNTRWDIARVTAGFSVFSYTGLFAGVFARGSQEIDFSSVGLGYAAVLGGAAALIFAKDQARTNAVSQVTKDATAADVAGAPAPEANK